MIHRYDIHNWEENRHPVHEHHLLLHLLRLLLLMLLQHHLWLLLLMLLRHHLWLLHQGHVLHHHLLVLHHHHVQVCLDTVTNRSMYTCATQWTSELSQ